MTGIGNRVLNALSSVKEQAGEIIRQMPRYAFRHKGTVESISNSIAGAYGFFMAYKGGDLFLGPVFDLAYKHGHPIAAGAILATPFFAALANYATKKIARMHYDDGSFLGDGIGTAGETAISFLLGAVAGTAATYL